MDATGLVALVMSIVLALMIGTLRRRVHRLEDVVLRLQDRVTDLSAKSGPSAAQADPASTPIDIEPFVD